MICLWFVMLWADWVWCCFMFVFARWSVVLYVLLVGFCVETCGVDLFALTVWCVTWGFVAVGLRLLFWVLV